MLKHKINTKSGITLIALVVTIIVLLILAGISVQMLTGNNGILQRAGEAKELTNVAQEKESITLAYNSALTDKIQKDNNNVTVDDLDKAIKSYDVRASVTSEREKLVVTFSNGNKYSIYNSGKITEYTTKPYAVDELTVKISGNTVESPYYVNYPSAKGTIKCRVLYNDRTYGLQIISVNPVTKVTLGKNDSSENVEGEMGSTERAQNSYMRAITTLNEEVEEYRQTDDESILATDVRSVGSNPLNKNFPDNLEGEAKKSQMYTDTESYMTNYNELFYKSDNNYFLDRTRLGEIRALNVNSSESIKNYWFATHSVSKVDGIGVLFGIVAFNCKTNFNTKINLWTIDENGVCNTESGATAGLRPVFILSPNVKILSGQGTEDNPFEIGL